MRAPRARCGCCGRSRPEEETTLIGGRSGGDYRRSSRSTRRRVCRDCTTDRIERVRRDQAEGRNAPVNEHRFYWQEAAKAFGIPITGLWLDSDRFRRAD